MRRKGSWFSSVKKALSSDSKEEKAKKEIKSKKKWSGKEKPSDPVTSALETVTVLHPHPLPPPEVTLTEVENEQTKHAYSVAVATAAAAEAAVAAAQAAAEVVRLTTVTQFTGKSKEEVAAIRIQTAFRGHLARRALRALRGLARLKSLVEGPTVKRQTTKTLKCMQTLSRVQSQIHYWRSRMLEENQALQTQLLQKHAKEIENLRIGKEWDDSLQSKEQIEASLLNKYEAAMRRERALAYSFSHQQSWKKNSKIANLLFMDPTNPHWGWSWIERWAASRPWETQSMNDKELKNDAASIKSASVSVAGGEITKAYAQRQLDSDKPSPPTSLKPSHSTHLSPSTPLTKAASTVAARKLRPASPRMSTLNQDDDTNSMFSVQSARNRRHSMPGSFVRDDESLCSSVSVPSYMAPTQSAKAKSRVQSPLSRESGTPPEKGSAGNAKKRLSFPSSPARPRRHSGPPKVDSSSIADKNGGEIS